MYIQKYSKVDTMFVYNHSQFWSIYNVVSIVLQLISENVKSDRLQCKQFSYTYVDFIV